MLAGRKTMIELLVIIDGKRGCALRLKRAETDKFAPAPLQFDCAANYFRHGNSVFNFLEKVLRKSHGSSLGYRLWKATPWRTQTCAKYQPSFSLTRAPALPKSIWPVYFCFKSPITLPISFSVSAPTSASAASTAAMISSSSSWRGINS